MWVTWINARHPLFGHPCIGGLGILCAGCVRGMYILCSARKAAAKPTQAFKYRYP